MQICNTRGLAQPANFGGYLHGYASLEKQEL